MRLSACLAVLLALSTSETARAQVEPPEEEAPAASTTPEPAETPQVLKARDLYRSGVRSVKRGQYAEALNAFERSKALRAHATTTFNIAACQRGLGEYTRARETLEQALVENAKHPGQLAPSLEQEARGLLNELEQLLARVTVRLEPRSAAILVDGRPLKFQRENGKLIATAGIEAPGAAKPAPQSEFLLLLNPGAHVFTLRRTGYTDAVVNRSFSAGARERLPLIITRLPATLRISSNIDGAIVRVGEYDLGPVPVEVRRPAGRYRIQVSQPGYESYHTDVNVRAGESSSLYAKLSPKSEPITAKWWFWTAAAAVVAGATLTTYALTRPEPEPPPYESGNTGWVVGANQLRF